MKGKKEDKFTLYLKIKEQQRLCSKYMNILVKEAKEGQQLFEECAVEMA